MGSGFARLLAVGIVASMPAWGYPTESTEPTVAAIPSEVVECSPPEPAFLSIATYPWTRIFIDGAQVGTTPLFRHALPPGKHLLEFINSEHGVVGAEEVELEQAELRKLKLVFLTEAEASRELDSALEMKPTSEDDCLATDSLRAWISVDIQPWARVFLDGRSIGTTPLFRHAVAPGAHVLRLVRADEVGFHARIAAEPGESVKVVLGQVPVKAQTEQALPAVPSFEHSPRD